MIEGDVTKNKETIAHLKYYYIILLNDVVRTQHDRPIEKYAENQIYEQ